MLKRTQISLIFVIVVQISFVSCFSVKFEVDTTNEPILSTNELYIELYDSDNVSVHELSPLFSNSAVYFATLTLETGEYYYQFLRGKNGELYTESLPVSCSYEDYRLVSVTGDIELLPVCYRQCEICSEVDYTSPDNFLVVEIVVSNGNEIEFGNWTSTLAFALGIDSYRLEIELLSSSGTFTVELKVYGASGSSALDVVSDLANSIRNKDTDLKSLRITEMKFAGSQARPFVSGAKGERKDVKLTALVVVIALAGMILVSVIVVYVAKQRRKNQKREAELLASRQQESKLQSQILRAQEEEEKNSIPMAPIPAFNESQQTHNVGPGHNPAYILAPVYNPIPAPIPESAPAYGASVYGNTEPPAMTITDLTTSTSYPPSQLNVPQINNASPQSSTGAFFDNSLNFTPQTTIGYPPQPLPTYSPQSPNYSNSVFHPELSTNLSYNSTQSLNVSNNQAPWSTAASTAQFTPSNSQFVDPMLESTTSPIPPPNWNGRQYQDSLDWNTQPHN